MLFDAGVIDVDIRHDFCEGVSGSVTGIVRRGRALHVVTVLTNFKVDALLALESRPYDGFSSADIASDLRKS